MWKYYENHPLIYRRDEDRGIAEQLVDGNWQRLDRTGWDTLQRKLLVTGDAVEVPFERIADKVA